VAGLSVLGLIAVGVVTLVIGSGDLPFSPGSGGGPNASGAGPAKTVSPSNVVVVPSVVPGIVVPGSLVYAKEGNIWIQGDGKAVQLTSGGTDSMPAFAPDGANVYFVRTRPLKGIWSNSTYQMDVPSLMKVATTGGDAVTVLDGLIDPAGSRRWMGFIREPAISPDGKTVAFATDLPDPTKTDVLIKFLNLANGKITDPGFPEVPPLGQQDPAWRPDGQVLAYVYNNRDGAKGAPQLVGYTAATGKRRFITGPGYLHPSWSPDGNYIAATRTSAFGTDVVIIAAATGAEVAQLSNDSSSWAPAWSPAGNQIAFLHVEGQVVDLRMVQLSGPAGAWTVSDPINLTSAAGLDSISRPSWFVPAAQLPPPTSAPPTPTPPALPSAQPSPS
jgi:dipeptidyl aminopeptidase/acylaminoacyl peptidase